MQEEEEEEHAHVSFADEVSEQGTQGQPMSGNLSGMVDFLHLRRNPKMALDSFWKDRLVLEGAFHLIRSQIH